MTNGASSSDAPLLPLSYAMHSGGGVQLQALTNAIFLANATGRRLYVPPWLVRNNMSRVMWDPTGITGRKCKTPYIDMSKQQINALSENMLCGLCDKLPEGRLESFASIYALDEMVRPLPTMTKEQCDACRRATKRCSTCQNSGLCPRVDLDTHLLLLDRYNAKGRERWPWATTGNSTKTVDCLQTLIHLQQSPRSCARLLSAVAQADHFLPASTDRSALCVGPLNDWFFEKPFGSNSTLLGRCASAHPMARLLQRRGLSLRREVVELLPKLYTRPCDICMYVRLPDKRKDLNSLHDALWSIDGRRLLSALARSWEVASRSNATSPPVRESGLEIVSSCRSDACRHPFSHNSSSQGYLSVQKRTRDMVEGIGPTLLAVHDEQQQRAAVAKLQALGMGPENANILYDQLRCARCRETRGLAGEMPRGGKGNAGFRVASSFYKTIERLNHQLHDRGAIPKGPKIPGIAKLDFQGSKEASTWVCKAQGRDCTEYVPGKGR